MKFKLICLSIALFSSSAFAKYYELSSLITKDHIDNIIIKLILIIRILIIR